MSILVGKKAPSFTASAVINGEEIVNNFSLGDYLGKQPIVLFFYPKDFTFVCPTELHAFQEMKAEFETRGAALIAVSTDTEYSHWGWLQVAKAMGGIQGVTYPLIADTDKTISMNYGVLAGEYEYNEDGTMTSTGPMIAYRGLFIIDKHGVVQHQLVNNFPIGRNVDEALRTLDAMIYHEEKSEVCPAKWKVGEEGMKADRSGVNNYLATN
jgi:peroxiredoxin 2/4